MINTIIGITIHNTNNDLSAKENLSKIINNNWNGYHYLVDEDEIIKLCRDNDVIFHTGKGYDQGNLKTISIGICKSTTNKYHDAEKNAIKLIVQLMSKYNIGKNAIYFHCDWNKTSFCPHRILSEFTKKEWIERRFIDV